MFSPPKSSKYTLLQQRPTRLHMVACSTGGLKHLYTKLRNNSRQPKIRTGDYTDESGTFAPEMGMPPMAHRYQYLGILGKGQSSVLVKVQDMFQGGAVRAVKVLHTHYVQLGVQESDCLRRINLADPYHMSATLRLCNTFSYHGHYCMTFETLCPQPITHYFQEMPILEVVPAIRKVALRLLQAIGFLQQQNVIHADLKPANILLQKESELSSVKVVDFGNAIHCIHEELSLYYDDFELQTLLYRAPEVVFGLPFGLEVDMWGLGCVLAELYLNRPLFRGSDKPETLSAMTDFLGPLPEEVFKRGKFFRELAEYTSRSSAMQFATTFELMDKLECDDYPFIDFLRLLLHYNPNERLTVAEAARHPFLAPELALGFVISTSGDTTYPAVPPDHQNYTKQPFVDEQRRQKHLSSTELLREGTCDTPPAAPKIAKVLPRLKVTKNNNSNTSTSCDGEPALRPHAPSCQVAAVERPKARYPWSRVVVQSRVDEQQTHGTPVHSAGCGCSLPHDSGCRLHNQYQGCFGNQCKCCGSNCHHSCLEAQCHNKRRCNGSSSSCRGNQDPVVIAPVEYAEDSLPPQSLLPLAGYQVSHTQSLRPAEPEARLLVIQEGHCNPHKQSAVNRTQRGSAKGEFLTQAPESCPQRASVVRVKRSGCVTDNKQQNTLPLAFVVKMGSAGKGVRCSTKISAPVVPLVGKDAPCIVAKQMRCANKRHAANSYGELYLGKEKAKRKSANLSKVKVAEFFEGGESEMVVDRIKSAKIAPIKQKVQRPSSKTKCVKSKGPTKTGLIKEEQVDNMTVDLNKARKGFSMPSSNFKAVPSVLTSDHVMRAEMKWSHEDTVGKLEKECRKRSTSHEPAMPLRPGAFAGEVNVLATKKARKMLCLEDFSSQKIGTTTLEETGSIPKARTKPNRSAQKRHKSNVMREVQLVVQDRGKPSTVSINEEREDKESLCLVGSTSPTLKGRLSAPLSTARRSSRQRSKRLSSQYVELSSVTDEDRDPAEISESLDCEEELTIKHYTSSTSENTMLANIGKGSLARRKVPTGWRPTGMFPWQMHRVTPKNAHTCDSSDDSDVSSDEIVLL